MKPLSQMTREELWALDEDEIRQLVYQNTVVFDRCSDILGRLRIPCARLQLDNAASNSSKTQPTQGKIDNQTKGKT